MYVRVGVEPLAVEEGRVARVGVWNVEADLEDDPSESPSVHANLDL